MVIDAFFAKIDIGHFLFSDAKQGGWFIGILIVLVVLYFRKEKQEIILSKYSKENEKERKRGNAIVSMYVVVSFLLIFIIAFFKPGKV